MSFSTSNKSVRISRMRYRMNTFCSIKAEAEDDASIAAGVEKAFLEIGRIEGLFSRYKSESQIYRLNKAGAQAPIKLNAEVFGLIAYGLQISRMTAGAFDITVGAAIDCWRCSKEQNQLPTESQLQELPARIGFEKVSLHYPGHLVLFSKPGIQIDLGALAKGYGLNRVVMILRQEGIERAVVNLGGNIYVLDNEPQTIAIRHPV
ncbi:MAG: FAD:protein FMN transferase, partial [Candidatus Omnitrophota bacterium]